MTERRTSQLTAQVEIKPRKEWRVSSLLAQVEIGTPVPPGPSFSYVDWDAERQMFKYAYTRTDAANYAKLFRAGYNDKFSVFNYPTAGEPGDPTDCTNFVSQALLYGGLPMTATWYADATEDDPKLGADHTGRWAGADLLPLYIGLQEPSLKIVGGKFWIHNQEDPSRIIYNFSTLATHGVYNSTTRDTIFQVTRELWINDITTGDVFFTLGPAKLQHVALIVGWGPYFTNWNDLHDFIERESPEEVEPGAYPIDIEHPGYDPNADAGQLSTLISPVRTAYYNVPYVIDHGSDIVAGIPPENWMAGPKPYYALFWVHPVPGQSEYVVGSDGRRAADDVDGFGFAHIADVLYYGTDEIRASSQYFSSKKEMLPTALPDEQPLYPAQE